MGEECVVALAGPAASLLLAWAAAAWGRRFGGVDAYLLTGVSLALGVFNLLPAGPWTGAGPPGGGDLAGGPGRGGVCGLLTKGLALGLAVLGIWVLGKSGNFMLLLCAGWLLCRKEGMG